ncbi:MAG: DUF1684 domain-containing protein [Deltaproteobacteria bacterium]|nr:DUF1684 domain-containing protein [Deltaproteobacteria bacterium]
MAGAVTAAAGGRRSPGVLVLAALAAGACGCAKDPYVLEVEAWHANRLEELMADDGWLTLAGLYWLKPGVNRIGSDAGAEVGLPPVAPKVVATITVTDDGRPMLEVAAGVPVTVDGRPVTKLELQADDHGAPTKLRLGRLLFYVIRRQGRLAVRLKDNDSGVRRRFPGIESYPIDAAFRVTARFERYAPKKPLTFATEIGGTDAALSPGAASFTLRGKPLRLDATEEAGGELSFVFGDATNGKTTYGGGRFLDATPNADGTVVLDFNEAYNPPCVFTPYATCPLPTAENRLAVAVEAGEKAAPRH